MDGYLYSGPMGLADRDEYITPDKIDYRVLMDW